MPPLEKQFVGKLLFARKSIGLSQCDQMLMPVQFPGDLAVANFLEIEIANLERRLTRRPLSVNSVAVPVDFCTVIQAFVPEQVKAVLADSLRLSNNSLYLFRHTLFQQQAKGWHSLRRKEETPRGCRVSSRNFILNTNAQVIAKRIQASHEQLSQPLNQFLPIHGSQPPGKLFPSGGHRRHLLLPTLQ